MICRWLHNRKYSDTPMCSCKWRMIPIENQFYDTWKCKWIEKCGWRVFYGPSNKLHWYRKG